MLRGVIVKIGVEGFGFLAMVCWDHGSVACKDVWVLEGRG